MFRIVRHWKGGLYTVIGEATHTETGETLVIYADAEGHLFARPTESFYDLVESPRFEDVEAGGAADA